MKYGGGAIGKALAAELDKDDYSSRRQTSLDIGKSRAANMKQKKWMPEASFKVSSRCGHPF